jgi:hypothetical protein
MTWAASAAGQQEEAIRYGQEAVAIRDPSFIAARYWPDFEELRMDSRFQEVLLSREWK